MKSRSLVASMRVRRRRSEPQLARGNRAIQRQRRSCDCARSQRAEIQPCRAIVQPRDVPQNHLHICEQPMRHQHRLGPLQMRVARHHGIAGLFRLLQQRFCPSLQCVDNQSDLLPHIQPQVGRDLFVSAAPGVQLQP